MGMPPAATARCANCACRRMRRSSLRCARATYRGLLPAILPFISVTARVASSAEENATNAEPRLLRYRVSCDVGKGEALVSDGVARRRTRGENPKKHAVEGEKMPEKNAPTPGSEWREWRENRGVGTRRGAARATW